MEYKGGHGEVNEVCTVRIAVCQTVQKNQVHSLDVLELCLSEGISQPIEIITVYNSTENFFV